MANDNGWKGWALAAVTGFLVGGLGGGLVGTNAATTVEARLNARVSKVEVNAQRSFDLIIAMNERLVRIETKLDEMHKER